MHKELDEFADTNERVRHELDRKDRVDYLKQKNEGEYVRSIEQVRSSQSPKKSPYKSPYHSPYKSPSK